MGGKGSIDELHPRAAGLIGRYSRKIANDVASEADLMLVVGSRLGGMVTDSWRVPRPGTRIVHIDVDPTVLGTTYREELSVVGDAKLTLQALCDALPAAGPLQSWGEWATRVERRVGEWHQRVEALAATSKPGAIHPAAIMQALREELAPTDVLVTDTGYMGAWAGALYPVTAPGRYFLRAAGSLGWSLPAALGRLARHARRARSPASSATAGSGITSWNWRPPCAAVST